MRPERHTAPGPYSEGWNARLVGPRRVSIRANPYRDAETRIATEAEKAAAWGAGWGACDNALYQERKRQGYPATREGYVQWSADQAAARAARAEH